MRQTPLVQASQPASQPRSQPGSASQPAARAVSAVFQRFAKFGNQLWVENYGSYMQYPGGSGSRLVAKSCRGGTNRTG